MSTPDAFADGRRRSRPAGRFAMRFWAVRHAPAMAAVWRTTERALKTARPAFARIGWARAERPVAAVERLAKGALFDCRMCGQCVLSSTGMACPMNCPKALRNGPCGGVRADGRCEVRPEMPCVWVEAVAGAGRMDGGVAIRAVQPPLDNRLAGRSSWLAAARGEGAS
jgi:hypothetical protein